MCLWRDVSKLSHLVGGISHFVVYSVLSITTKAAPLSAVTMMWFLVFPEIFHMLDVLLW